MRTGPCAPWATTEDLCVPCSDLPDDPELIDAWLQASSEILWARSGRQFSGECEITVRPCARPLSYSAAPSRSVLSMGGYTPRGWACACHQDVCGCPGRSVVRLPNLPVREITEVIVGTDTLNPSAYRVDDERDLVRLDGEGWPLSQNLRAAAGEESTFEVTYTFGTDPPVAGVKAAAALACEFIKACDPKAGDCALSPQVQSLTRQGVQVVMSDPALLLTQGLFGIPAVDRFLLAYNPKQLQQDAVVWSPEIASGAIQPG